MLLLVGDDWAEEQHDVEVQDEQGRATLLIAALVGLAVATPTFAYASSISSDSYLAILIRAAQRPAGVLPPPRWSPSTT